MVANKINYITKEWYEKLVEELKDYREVKLPTVLERLSEAKAMWDLSENFEYKSAMEDRDFISSKVSELDNLLSNVEIIKDEKSKKDDVVDYGSKVLIKIEWDKNEYTIKIVWTWEVGISWKDDLLVSLDSPIWAAIKWHKAWDDVKMRLGNDRKTIKVLKIS